MWKDRIIKCLYGLTIRLLIGVGAALQPASSATFLKPDEQVVLYPTLGWRVKDGWQVEIHGRVFESGKSPVLQHALGIDEKELSPDERDIFISRARLFFDDSERGKQISVAVRDQTYELQQSQANGHFDGRIRIAGSTVGLPDGDSHTMTFGVIHSNALVRPAPGEIHLLDSIGLSVISDIDDTIKITDVRNRAEMARNTLCRPFRPAPGMAGLYQSWSTNAGAQFHYVSASPWQLYQPLSEFIGSNGFPAGTFHMKYFRFKDGSFWDLFKSPERYKPGVIEPMLKRFSERRFILVGDSGEKDPEIYGAIARRHEKQILKICIRDVTCEPEVPRYRDAFKGLPRDLWTVFKDPAELSPLKLNH